MPRNTRLLWGETDYMTVESTADFDQPGAALLDAGFWLDQHPDVIPISMTFHYDITDDEWTATLVVSGYREDDE